MSDSSSDDAARRREYQRQWRAANADRIRAQKREYESANRDKIRERQRKYREANRDRFREYGREYRKANYGKIQEQQREHYQEKRQERLEYARQHRLENGDEIRRRRREDRKANPRRYRDQGRRHRHGVDGGTVAALWEAQQHNCYLCGKHLDLDKAFVEHWHGCQSGHDPKKSCSFCRRGLAHHDCNILISAAKDDPDLLRLIADNLEAANRDVAERQLKAPQQLTLEL